METKRPLFASDGLDLPKRMKSSLHATQEQQQQLEQKLSPGDNSSRHSFKVRTLSLGRNCHTNDEIHTTIDFRCPVMMAFLDTPQMQRLRGLKQLGTAEYVYMNCNHNRFEHSVGVAYLAERLCRKIQERQPQLICSDKDVLCVKLAGLLHDIGHGPFSHTYEKFVTEALPHHLKKQERNQKANNHQWESYMEIRKQIPQNWTHEMASLAMIDSLLEYLGLQIDLDNLDQPLKQIGDGVDARSLRVYNAAVESSQLKEFKDITLTSRDLVFIKECITGGPVPEISEKFGEKAFVGRPMREKEWLYDIVSNSHSGLDVDKIDYFARDQRRAYRAAGEIEKVMIEEAVVAWASCTKSKDCWRCRNKKLNGHRDQHLMICYPEKSIPAAINFFKKRFELYTNIYHHKTSVATGHMICDILCQADPHFRLATNIDGEKGTVGRGKIPTEGLPISCAMLDNSAYGRLKDSVIDLIENTTDPNLMEARAIIRRLHERDLYKCAYNLKLDMETESEIWQLTEDDIKMSMLQMNGKHGEGEEQIQLEEDDFIVDKVKTHHGQKDSSPLQFMRFVDKINLDKLTANINDLPEAHQIDETRHRAELPQIWQENSIRIYCRESSKADLVRHVSEAWIVDIKIECNKFTPTLENGDQRPLQILSQESHDDDDENYDEFNDNDDSVARSPMFDPNHYGRSLQVTPLHLPVKNCFAGAKP